MGNFLQPIRSTTQIWEVTPQQYGVFAFVPQTSFRGKINSGVAECRLFSWAAFKSNHRHSKLTNRNVALRAAHRNSRIWICRKKRYQCKEWEQRKKRFIFLAVSRRLPCACDWKLFSARGAQRTVPSILVTLVGTVGIFSAPSKSVFASWHHKSKKNQHWEERAQLFVGIMGTARVSHLTVTRIVAGKSKFITIRKLSLTIKTTFSD